MLTVAETYKENVKLARAKIGFPNVIVKFNCHFTFSWVGTDARSSGERRNPEADAEEQYFQLRTMKVTLDML